VAVNKSNERGKNINGGKNGSIGENKGDDIKKRIKKSINEKINKEPLFKKKRIYYTIFLKRL